VANPKLFAFHLPQFHPIAENDEWWGPGFTEWRNVAQGRPLFEGHYQPHYPADLGYYDLRLPEVREHQAALARQYGINGFCYYHYWFAGKQLLQRPVSEILTSGKPDFPFCLCWANENWTRRWDGADQEVLISQEYSIEDDRAHFQALLPYFKDSRYIRINNKPLFLVYRSTFLPNCYNTTSLWRQQAKANGLEDLYLVKLESLSSERQNAPKQDGFDAALDFQPDWGALPKPIQPPRRWKLLKKLGLAKSHPFTTNLIYSYPEVVKAMLSRPSVEYPRFPCVVPSWDNYARRRGGNAIILHGSTPEAYGKWLSAVLGDQTVFQRLPEPIVFINAWNEWAEGNHLEPDLKWGHQYLEKTFNSLGQPDVQPSCDYEL
jgi:lipopolysaccharide biosynthesis protein